MSEIAVDFLLGPDWSSRLIARYGIQTGGWSHCASVLKDGRYLDARSDVLHRVDKTCNVPDIVPAGVHIRDPKSEKWVRKQRATLQVTDAEYDDWEANLRAKITTAYGRSDIVNIILGRPGHVAGQWICSALMINAVQHVSRSWTAPHLGRVPYPLPAPAHQISPDMALMILATAGFTLGPIVAYRTELS
jgi:hypothetical protein